MMRPRPLAQPETDMLYQLYETQRALMSPFSEFASASAKLYDHPLSPFAHTPLASACRPAST
jgi:poly-beta-hydroxyalkanoate depolymerase